MLKRNKDMEKEYRKRIGYLSTRSRFCLTSRIQLIQLKNELKTLLCK
jgi:hypothetical protein